MKIILAPKTNWLKGLDQSGTQWMADCRLMIDISKVTEDPDGSHKSDKEMIESSCRCSKNVGIYAVWCQ